MQGTQGVAEFWTEGVAEQVGRAADQGDVAVQLAQAGGEFAAGETATDDDHPAFGGAQVADESFRVGHGAEHVHAGIVAGSAGQVPGFDAGGDDQAVVGQFLATGQFHDPAAEVQALRLGAQSPADVEFGIGSQDQVGGFQLACDDLLDSAGRW